MPFSLEIVSFSQELQRTSDNRCEHTLTLKFLRFFLNADNMVLPSSKNKPVQGGFLVLRPDMDVYKEFVEIIEEGDFQEHKG